MRGGCGRRKRDRSLVVLTWRPHPMATLFPYTTLFRSRHRRHRVPPRRLDLPARLRRTHSSRTVRGGRTQDRKSTRLNSSHPSISYAVFFLKKKNMPVPRLDKSDGSSTYAKS